MTLFPTSSFPADKKLLLNVTSNVLDVWLVVLGIFPLLLNLHEKFAALGPVIHILGTWQRLCVSFRHEGRHVVLEFLNDHLPTLLVIFDHLEIWRCIQLCTNDGRCRGGWPANTCHVVDDLSSKFGWGDRRWSLLDYVLSFLPHELVKLEFLQLLELESAHDLVTFVVALGSDHD